MTLDNKSGNCMPRTICVFYMWLEHNMLNVYWKEKIFKEKLYEKQKYTFCALFNFSNIPCGFRDI